MIDWTNPARAVSRHFTVFDVIHLPRWGRLARESDGLNDHVKDELTRFFCGFMDPICDFLGVPIAVHCAYRPKDYNDVVGGAPDSAHMCGGFWAAADWDPRYPDMEKAAACDLARSKLEPQLEQIGIRMEKTPGGLWIHTDNRPPQAGGHRYFIP